MFMKASVIYFSRTGNTRQVAKEIAGVLKTGAMDVKSLKGFSPAGLLVVGSGTYANKAGKEMISFLRGLPKMKGAKAAVFGSSGAGDFNESGGLNDMKSILEEKGARIVGTFCCQGKVFYIFNRGHPSEEELGKARKFAAGLE